MQRSDHDWPGWQPGGIINEDTTKAIGELLKNTVGLALNGKAALDDGELLFARVGAGNFVASASQSIHKANGKVTVDGTANAKTDGRGQFAAAIVNDPLYFNADSFSLDPQITLQILSDLLVHADPGEMALAAVQVGKDGNTVLDFVIEVNNGVSSASQALRPISCDSSALGMSCSSYLDTFVLPFLDWSSGTRTISATSNINVSSMAAPSEGFTVEAILNYAGVVSTPSPEPGTGALMALGIGAVLATVRRRKIRLENN